MRVRVVLFSIILVVGSILALGGLTSVSLFLIALIGGVIVVLDWAYKPQTAKGGFREKPVSAEPVIALKSVLRQGALIGAFIGFLYGVVADIEYYVIMLPMFLKFVLSMITSDPRFAANPKLPEVINMVTNITYYIGLIVLPLGAVIGCVLGVVFVALMQKIPGRTTVRKAVFFSMVLFAVTNGYSMLRNLLGYENSPEVARVMSTPQSSLFMRTMTTMMFPLLAVNLLAFLSLGFLFGYLLDRKLRAK